MAYLNRQIHPSAIFARENDFVDVFFVFMPKSEGMDIQWRHVFIKVEGRGTEGPGLVNGALPDRNYAGSGKVLPCFCEFSGYPKKHLYRVGINFLACSTLTGYWVVHLGTLFKILVSDFSQHSARFAFQYQGFDHFKFLLCGSGFKMSGKISEFAGGYKGVLKVFSDKIRVKTLSVRTVKTDTKKESTMARKSIHDPNQLTLPGFEAGKEAICQVYDEYKKMDRALRDIIKTNPVRPGEENEFELCQAIGTALMLEIRESGLSRDEFVDKVNEFFGRTNERYALKECRKPLTRADVEKWISDYTKRPVPAYYLFAFQHILGFGVINDIVGATGGQVTSQEERRVLALAQLGELEARIRDTRKVLKQ